ncbi:MAG: hypothetical protein KGJ80_03820 [Chloroflexota bacterium]|nr:hypothetical protein [Chloroflexota bacterium]
MWRVLTLISLMLLSIVLMQTGLLRTFSGTVELGSFFFGVCLLASIGFLAFQVRVWGGNTRAIFNARPASLIPGPSAFQVVRNGVGSSLAIIGIIICAIVVALEYEGRHDVVVRVWDLSAGKTEKLIYFLLH